MGKEIERKFLVSSLAYRNLAEKELYRQGFLSTDQERVIRVRVVGEKGFITVKGENKGMTRTEFEYAIPLQDANQMLEEMCLKPIIEKYRYRIKLNNRTWEVDEFIGDNSGLIIAEVELTKENDSLIIPEWVGREVTNDARYYNSNLVENPYKLWEKS